MIQITDPKIEQLLQVAQQASAEVMKSYKKPLQISEKEDHTPVTNADMASHKILATQLPKIIDIPLLSEEGEHPIEELAKWEMFWVIDPIDGTKGFINETDDFAINIGIVSKGQPVLGVICIPISDQVYCAVKGGGAFKFSGEEWTPIKVAAKEAAPAKVKVIASRPTPSARTEALCEKIGKLGEFDYQSIGSAIKFAVMAEGGAHLYPRFGQSCWWDTVAGQCLVEEAGGAVVDANLQPLEYNVGDNEKLLNPNFIACAYQDEDWTQSWTKINKEEI